MRFNVKDLSGGVLTVTADHVKIHPNESGGMDAYFYVTKVTRERQLHSTSASPEVREDSLVAYVQKPVYIVESTEPSQEPIYDSLPSRPKPEIKYSPRIRADYPFEPVYKDGRTPTMANDFEGRANFTLPEEDYPSAFEPYIHNGPIGSGPMVPGR